jgi:phospholipase/carboxylesterase
LSYRKAMQQKNIGNLNCYVIEPDADVQPDSVVVLFHGYGADGRDLISIADMWAERLNNVVFIAPDSPEQCEDSPFGKQWFSLNPYTKESMISEVQGTSDMMDDFIQNIYQEYGVKRQRTVLSGFSQGAMMALHTALTSSEPFAGVLGYSGMLLDDEAAKNSLNKKTPIHLVHGTADTVVPSAEWNEATSLLKKLNYPTSGYKTKGLEHSIDFQGIDSGMFFLVECLS